MPKSILDRTLLFAIGLPVYVMALLFLLMSFGVGSTTLHQYHQEYWVKEGPWRGQLTAAQRWLASWEHPGESIAYFEGHIQAYPDSPQRSEWEHQIRHYRGEQRRWFGAFMTGLLISYLVVFVLVCAGVAWWQSNRWGIRRRLPLILISYLVWALLAWSVTLPLMQLISTVSDGAYDPFNLDRPLEQTESYWRPVIENSRPHSPEWDVAVRSLAAVHQERVLRWTVWLGAVTGLFVVSGVGWSALRWLQSSRASAA